MLNKLRERQPGDPELDGVFHALADPTRRAMLVRLCEGPATVSELAEPFRMSLAGIVQHLQVMEASGLIRSEKIGRVRSCSVNPAAVRRAENWLGQRRTPGERRIDRLEDFLDAAMESTDPAAPAAPAPEVRPPQPPH